MKIAISLGWWKHSKRMAYLLRQPLNWLLTLNINARKYRNNRAIVVSILGIAHSNFYYQVQLSRSGKGNLVMYFPFIKLSSVLVWFRWIKMACDNLFSFYDFGRGDNQLHDIHQTLFIWELSVGFKS